MGASRSCSFSRSLRVRAIDPFVPKIWPHWTGGNTRSEAWPSGLRCAGSFRKWATTPSRSQNSRGTSSVSRTRSLPRLLGAPMGCGSDSSRRAYCRRQAGRSTISSRVLARGTQRGGGGRRRSRRSRGPHRNELPRGYCVSSDRTMSSATSVPSSHSVGSRRRAPPATSKAWPRGARSFERTRPPTHRRSTSATPATRHTADGPFRRR